MSCVNQKNKQSVTLSNITVKIDGIKTALGKCFNNLKDVIKIKRAHA